MKNIKKITAAGIFAAASVALSAVYVPVGAAKCYPVQHTANVLAGVMLGPGYAVAAAFTASVVRNLLGTGSLLAFPGSMIGALCAGLMARRFKGSAVATCLGEVFGTGVLGAIVSYPVAAIILGRETAVFAYVVPFVLSSAGGAAIAFAALNVLTRTGVLKTGSGA